jgi:hypothetical protein
VTKSSNHTLSLHRLTSYSFSTTNFPWLFHTNIWLYYSCTPLYSVVQLLTFQFSSLCWTLLYSCGISILLVLLLPSNYLSWHDHIENNSPVLLVACVFERVYLAPGFCGSIALCFEQIHHNLFPKCVVQEILTFWFWSSGLLWWNILPPSSGQK